MKIRQVGAELLHADGRTDKTDGHNEANSRFSQFWNTPNRKLFPTRTSKTSHTRHLDR